VKHITITNADEFDLPEASNSKWQVTGHGSERMDASDGYHTFTELYEHRITLFIAFLKGVVWSMPNPHVWRSKLHHDGSKFEGWFILGIGKKKGKQITYHLPLSAWKRCQFAETLKRAPEWDGHTSADVLSRLENYWARLANNT
jgi:hypothetical protein